MIVHVDCSRLTLPSPGDDQDYTKQLQIYVARPGSFCFVCFRKIWRSKPEQKYLLLLEFPTSNSLKSSNLSLSFFKTGSE